MWSGTAHDDPQGRSISAGGLVGFCPACPQPTVNLPPNWKDDTQKYVYFSHSADSFLLIAGRWKYMIKLMQDGNFKLEHLQYKVTADDIRLSDGHGFMVESTRYKQHLLDTAKAPPPVIYSSQCLFIFMLISAVRNLHVVNIALLNERR